MNVTCKCRGVPVLVKISVAVFLILPEVMTALIVVLPLIVVVEISLQLHRSFLDPTCTGGRWFAQFFSALEMWAHVLVEETSCLRISTVPCLHWLTVPCCSYDYISCLIWSDIKLYCHDEL
jgi:hypothetical protein